MGRRGAWSTLVLLAVFFLAGVARAGTEDVVEVRATLRGSGTLILVGGEPMVLTVSHLLKGKTEAHLYLPSKLIRLDGVGRVVRDFPAYDFALVELPADISDIDRRMLTQRAGHNASICSNGLDSCQPEVTYPSFLPSQFSGVSGVIDGAFRSTLFVDGYEPTLQPDFYVSGLFQSIILIPNFSYPGFSGGALYSNGQFLGVITMVSLAAEALTVAIPLHEIVRILSARDGEAPLESKWAAGPGGSYSLLVKDKGVFEDGKILPGEEWIRATITSFAGANGGGRGGPTGGGRSGSTSGGRGGPTGGGGSDGETKFWQLDLRDGKPVKTLNPFSASESTLAISKNSETNFQRVSRLEFRGQPLAPSLANYIWSKRRAPEEMKLDLFHSELRRAAIFSYGLRHARLYRKYSHGRLRLLNVDCELRLGDFSQPLYPVYDTGFVPAYESKCGRSHRRELGPDPSGFYLGNPFDVKNAAGFGLNVRFHPANWIPERAEGVTEIRIASDLRQIEIGTPRGVRALTPVSSTTGSIRLYQNPDGNDRAVVFLSQDDLRTVSRVFIEMDDFVAEFFNCKPGSAAECVR